MVSFKTAAIVLGGGLREKNEFSKRFYVPEPQVIERLNKAHELLITGVVDCIIATGKYSKRVGIDPKINGPQTEAEVGRQYLINRFEVPEGLILMETDSFDTIGNAWFAKVRCLIPHGIHDVKVITSEYHMSRSQLIFEWVLGPDYDIDYFDTPSGMSSPELVERGKLETAFIKFMREHLMPAIENGDDKRIDEFMECEHLRYCLSPLSEEMFNTFMKTAAIKAGYKQR